MGSHMTARMAEPSTGTGSVTLSRPWPGPSLDAEPSFNVLVASDGDAGSGAAVRFARVLSRERHVRVRVLCVSEHTHDDRMRGRTDLLLGVRRQLLAFGCEEWPTELATGSPAAVIPDHAMRAQADLLVLGLNEHGALDRALWRETAPRVLQRTTVPTVALTPWTTGLPDSILVAIDFSRESLAAARAAIALAADRPRVTFVHVIPDRERQTNRALPTESVFERTVEQALARLASSLERPGLVIETLLLHGDPPVELLTLADRSHADLVGLGARGERTVDRTGSSLRGRFARNARHSLLVAQSPASAITET